METLSQTGDMEEAAKNLYAAMHRLDHQNLDLIIAEKMPAHGMGLAINDKLERAATT
jgi:L-threonylcarbamoyladenylate synthase